MTRIVAAFGRVAATAAMVALAVLVGWQLRVHFMDDPWTRDGRVRADVVGVAPDVSGLISQVLVHDNEAVQKGDMLLRIDPARFSLALRQAQATVDARQAALVEAVHEATRYRSLTTLSVSQEKQQQTEAAQAMATAAFQQAVADRDLARIRSTPCMAGRPEWMLEKIAAQPSTVPRGSCVRTASSVSSSSKLRVPGVRPCPTKTILRSRPASFNPRATPSGAPPKYWLSRDGSNRTSRAERGARVISNAASGT